MNSRVMPGDRVTWNDLGKRLSGDTGSEGLVVGITEDGESAQVLWESGQYTVPTLSTLSPVA